MNVNDACNVRYSDHEQPSAMVRDRLILLPKTNTHLHICIFFINQKICPVLFHSSQQLSRISSL